MSYRCKYRLSDKFVLGFAVDAPAGFFDDANHGTTIQFSGSLSQTTGKIYDDTPGAEQLVPNSNFGAYLNLSTDRLDSDGDGLDDVPSDGVTSVTITIQKRDANGNAMTGAGNAEDFFLETMAGELDIVSGSLVNGAATAVLQPSTRKGGVVNIMARDKTGDLGMGQIRIKFI